MADAAVAHASRRQHAIECSSTEAELMGLAECALELLYIRSVMRDLGHVFEADESQLETKDPEAHRLVSQVQSMIHGPTEVGTDNSGAYDLYHRDSRGRHSRHIERKYFKMRELHHDGTVKLVLILTAEMAADMMTKSMDDKTFERHRCEVMNLKAVA